jgi:carbonic anhydrase
VGHTECGGAAACYGAVKAQQSVTIAEVPPTAPINRWLAPMTALAHSLTLPAAPADAMRLLVEENVKAQVANLCKAETITSAWSSGKKVWVHGWVYEIGSGTLKDLGVSKGPPA